MLSGLLISAHDEDDGHGPQSLIDIADISTMALFHAMVQASRISPTPLVIGDDQRCRMKGIMKGMSQSPDYNCNGMPKAGFLIDSGRYNEDHGEGAMQEMVNKIREERRRAAQDRGAS
ncbi:hypothetical protein FOC4_g10000475 [Fusarium odoratissimum]|uniref:Uncharacterized protein n=1 Tax=Fusarium oxysporum f. sp. cubense (strain race 4) TaxID=2502994 RepID=N1RTL8_FUSC4|nr:hypothetical protein FOC4_g10000475 [Fusarium odoratissimum]